MCRAPGGSRRGRARIDHLVLSHLHFDHAGGAELLPNARLVVQKREWEAGADDDIAARCAFDARDYRSPRPSARGRGA